MIFVAGYIAALVAFVAADMVWLGIMVEKLYRPAIGDMLSTSVNLPAAVIFYLIFPVGLTIFAVFPAAQNQLVGNAAALGGFFGFFAYATYDLTNQATLRNWPMRLTVIDLAWGSRSPHSPRRSAISRPDDFRRSGEAAAGSFDLPLSTGNLRFASRQSPTIKGPPSSGRASLARRTRAGADESWPFPRDRRHRNPEGRPMNSIDLACQATEYIDEFGRDRAVHGALFDLGRAPHPRARGVVAHGPVWEQALSRRARDALDDFKVTIVAGDTAVARFHRGSRTFQKLKIEVVSTDQRAGNCVSRIIPARG